MQWLSILIIIFIIFGIYKGYVTINNKKIKEDIRRYTKQIKGGK